MFEDIDNINNLHDLERVAARVISIPILSNDDGGAAKNNDRIMLKNYLYSRIIARKKALASLQTAEKINLKHVLKRTLLKRNNLWKIYKRYPYINRDLGAVPQVFLEKAEDKKNCAKKIYELFAKYSLILNYDFGHKDDKKHVEVVCLKDKLAGELSDLINKKVEISFAGNGFFGNGYKITLYKGDIEYSFFYKVFFPYETRKKIIHGADIEVMNAYFANKNGRKKQFAKFFMGRMASPVDKDAFILSEFVENKSNQDIIIKQPLSIDYIDSMDKRVENKINGRVVDFGDIDEYAPELNDRALRRAVRVILIRVMNEFSESNIQFTWKMSKNNCNSLKKYSDKIDDKVYNKAIKFIKKYILTIPTQFLTDLKKIKKWEENHEIYKKKYLQQSDLITCNTKKLLRGIRYLNLHVSSYLDGSEKMFGYIMVDLYMQRQAVYILDKDNNITRIRLERKVDDKFETIVELFGEDEINSFTSDNFVALLES